MALRPFNSIAEIKAKANAKPTIEERSRPVNMRPIGRPNTRITDNVIKHGSTSVKTNRLTKLVLDIEKTAKALGGMTANSPTMTAKSGKMNLESRTEISALSRNSITIVIVVNSERARQRLR